MIDVCLLGCGGMMPLPDRGLSALLYRFNGKMILIDCGEGTQIPIKMAGWGFKSIEAICFTHYHADHVAGLPGLLSTIGNSGRSEPLTLCGPPCLREVVKGLTVIVPNLPYAIELVELSNECLSAIRIGGICLKSIPVDHTLPCLAYSLEVKRAGRFDVERANSLGIPKVLWGRLQNGEVIENEGSRYLPEMVLGKPRKGLKVTYCTDTRPLDSMIDFCKNSDLFVCEGMYGEDEKKPDAILKKHMTYSEAAVLAKEGNARELWLTHYSPLIKDPDQFLSYASNIFKNSVPGQDLMTKTLAFDK